MSAPLPVVERHDREAEATVMALAGELVGPLTCAYCNRPCFATVAGACWRCPIPYPLLSDNGDSGAAG